MTELDDLIQQKKSGFFWDFSSPSFDTHYFLNTDPVIPHDRFVKQDNALAESDRIEFLWKAKRDIDVRVSFAKKINFQLCSPSLKDQINIYVFRLEQAIGSINLEVYSHNEPVQIEDIDQVATIAKSVLCEELLRHTINLMGSPGLSSIEYEFYLKDINTLGHLWYSVLHVRNNNLLDLEQWLVDQKIICKSGYKCDECDEIIVQKQQICWHCNALVRRD